MEESCLRKCVVLHNSFVKPLLRKPDVITQYFQYFTGSLNIKGKEKLCSSNITEVKLDVL